MEHIMKTRQQEQKLQKKIYVVHPAFKDGSGTEYSNGEWKSEVLGIWVAKFQAGIKTTERDTSTKISNSSLTVNNYYYSVFKGRNRGGNLWNSYYCGLCGLSDNIGHASYAYGFRSVLVVEQTYLKIKNHNKIDNFIVIFV